MGKIRGTVVTLYTQTVSSYDSFGAPVVTETAVNVDNVLIGEPSSDEIVDELNTSGKRLAYTLAIPKGDKNVWTDRKVSFWGKDFRTFGEVTQGIEEIIPLSWNKKVKVQVYE